MKYGRFVFAIAALSLAACSSSKPASVVSASQVHNLGTFKKEIFMPSTSPRKEFLTIENGTVTVTAVCKYFLQKVTAKVTVPAQISESGFNVTTSASKTEKLFGRSCVASIEAGVTAYEISNNELYLTPADGVMYFYGYAAGKRPTTLEQLGAFKDSIINGIASTFTWDGESYAKGTQATKDMANSALETAKAYGKQVGEGLAQDQI